MVKAYDWMVKCTPQTEWIEHKGILLWLAFFFIELGAGAYFVGSFFNSLPAKGIGWLLCGLLGGGLHFLYLGRPFRFYRMVVRPQTSWISRGMIFVSLFLLLGFINIVLGFFSITSSILSVLTIVLSFLVVIYGGFAMCCINGIPLWNTALLPIIYVASGLWGGAGITLGVAVAKGSAQMLTGVEEWVHLLLISFIILLFTYLISINYGTIAAKTSISEIIKGKGWYIFWIVVVIIGIGIPVIAMMTGSRSTPAAILYLTLLCELLGDLGMRYLILKYGFYNPLIPKTT
ncbi:MAG: polysulfide reductase NrfD [Syntrophorhabdaceae bacterium]|nr:polysulfide reductase NrfD [Syntrophorhabdaceae bacterium]MDD5242792.1 polysulfide reductase NrfD [Syntrophorhabdaceae bacterium]